VQQLRIEEAKRRLERAGEAIEEIGWRVGYEDPAFFRRRLKRVTEVTPGQYRRQFQIPALAAGRCATDRARPTRTPDTALHEEDVRRPMNALLKR
jgi:AraC-like DNA-binding protein